MHLASVRLLVRLEKCTNETAREGFKVDRHPACAAATKGHLLHESYETVTTMTVWR